MIICGNHFSRKIWKKERFSHRASRMTASRLKLLLNLVFLQRGGGGGGGVHSWALEQLCMTRKKS